MFDFAISHNQRRRPTRRLFASVAASCLIHLFLLVVLIENPWLLEGGLYPDFRGWLISPDDSAGYESDTEDENLRTITVLRPMASPSMEVLKQLTYNWDNPPKEEVPPTQIRWGNDEKTAPDEDIRISATIDTKPEPAPAGNKESTRLEGNLEDNSSGSGGAPEAPPSESAGITPTPAPKEDAITPVVESPQTEDVALNIAPSRIPDAIPPSPEQSSTTEDIKIFDNEQQAINSPGSGFFSAAKGWPLKEYANLIKQRVTGNWEIPSNLRNSDGHTTIVFFIDRNGQHFGARIVESSGNNSLNITALNAIISSNPFPPLPQGFPGDHVGVKYVFIPKP